MRTPSFQPILDGSRVRSVCQWDEVAFEGFNKALGYAIALGALHWSRYWFKSQDPSKGSSTTRDVARPIIRKPLHFVGLSLTSVKPIFNSLHHQISNKISVNPFSRSHPTRDLLVTAIQGKRDTNLFTVITPNFKAVRTPTDVTLIDRYRALMPSRIYRPAVVTIEQQVMVSRYAISLLGADAVNSVVDTLMEQDARNTSIPIGVELFNHCTDISKQRRVVRLGRSPSSVRPRGLSFCKSRDMNARNTKNRVDNSYFSSPRSKGDRAFHFRALPYSTVSLRISFSRVFRPKAPSSCLMRLSASTMSDADTTGSLAATAPESPMSTPSSIGIVGLPQSQPAGRPSTRSCSSRISFYQLRLLFRCPSPSAVHPGYDFYTISISY
jgi:hypothetical protein